jgi:hypothetical protein
LVGTAAVLLVIASFFGERGVAGTATSLAFGTECARNA